MIVRVAAGLVALVCCAWFVLGIRQAHDLSQATAIVSGTSLSRAQAARATSQLKAAGTLNPDLNVKLRRAELAFRQSHSGRAIGLAEQAAHSEPQNIVAWFVVARVSAGDNRLLLEAFRHIRQLRPPVSKSS